VAIYCGWYDENASGPFARPKVEFVPGAFAYHLHSFSAATLRSTTRQWVGPLLAKGATATMGCVNEPYLGATPNVAIFMARWVFSGFTFGEAAYAGSGSLSWQTTVVGDPLYCPFGRPAQELHHDLELRHSPLLAWSFLRVLNTSLLTQTPRSDIIKWLETQDLTRQSAVLTEKLADLYWEEGKPASCVHALQQVLKLDSTPQQRVRVMRELAPRLISLERTQEAYEVDQSFVKDFADYPDLIPIYRELEELATRLGKTGEAAGYQAEIDRLNGSHASPLRRIARPGP
jgi:hypothetical protein